MGFAPHDSLKHIYELLDLYKRITLIQNRKNNQLMKENEYLNSRLRITQRELANVRSKFEALKRRCK